jgi:outer membrane protein TolC
MLLRDTMNLYRLRGHFSSRMSSLPLNRQQCAASASGQLLRLVGVALVLSGLLSVVPSARAQISLSTAVDLALRSSPRVQGSESDVAKARAQLSESRDVYVPAVTAGAGIGQAYGYSPNPPTLATVTGTALVYNSAQFSYSRSAQAGVNAALLALEDVREAVAQDTALAFIAFDHDQQREQVLRQQASYADTLVNIVQQRVDAGQDTQIELTQAKLSAAQLRLGTLRAQDETANDRDRLAQLIGLPAASLHVDNSFPASPIPSDMSSASVHGYASAAVASAFANAEARRQQARGDATFRFRPQINMFAQYNRYATFSDSFKQLQNIYRDSSGHTILTANEGFFGVQISVPLFDKYRGAKARESAADAAKAFHDAQNAQIEALDGQSRMRHTISELQVQAEVAALQQQLAQQQLDVLHVQLQAGTGNPNGQPMTPKDEQNARITERDKYLGVIDASFQLRQAEIQLLRQSGQLEAWLKSANLAQPPASTLQNIPPNPNPQP